MAEETAEEATQTDNTKGLAAKKESNKRKRAEESQEQQNRLAAQREITEKNHAEESQEQRESMIAAQGDNA